MTRDITKIGMKDTVSRSSSGIKCLSNQSSKTPSVYLENKKGVDYEINPHQRQHYSSLSNNSGNIWDQQLEDCWID